MRDMSASLNVVRIAAVCWSARPAAGRCRWRTARSCCCTAGLAGTGRWSRRAVGARAPVDAGAPGAVRACGSWPVGQGVEGRGGVAAGGDGGGGGRCRRRGGRGRGNRAEHVSLGDPPARSGAGDAARRRRPARLRHQSADRRGESGRSPAPGSPCGTGAGPPAAVSRPFGRSAAAWPAAGAAPADAAAPAGSIVPTVAPMATVSPSGTPIFRIPEPGAGTTFVALSVSSSSRGSPACTGDPSALSQRETMPSEIDSPTLGTVIGTGTADMESPVVSFQFSVFSFQFSVFSFQFGDGFECSEGCSPAVGSATTVWPTIGDPVAFLDQGRLH